MSETKGRFASAVEVAAGLSVIAACATAIWFMASRGTQSNSAQALTNSSRPAGRPARPAALLPSSPIAFSDAPFKGKSATGNAMMVFSDFECPFCAKFAREMFPVLDRDYFSSGKVTFGFRHLPLTSLHPTAFDTAIAAECAD